MEKLLDAILDTIKDLAKGRLAFLGRWVGAIFSGRDFLLTWVSHSLRRTGDKTLLIVALLASGWALYGFVASLGTGVTTKASHDAILKIRFSSPQADPRIVILDVDERSIAALSEKHGRWPWSRDVLASGLENLDSLGAKAVLFNVLLAEPDKRNPSADAAMAATAEIFRPAGFPLIRLAQENDALSEIKVSMLPNAEVSPGAEDKTIALIVPLFAAMHDRLGIANQLPDADGIVRRYPYWWTEGSFRIPSIVQSSLTAGEISTKELPERYALNWRNKKEGYQRISFSDLYLDKLTEAQKNSLRQAIVVLGVSAPGIGQTKPTGIKAIVDDGEILATALDDAINNTYLRVTPAWMLFGLNLVSIWLLYLAFSNRVAKSPPINRIFLVLQSALGGITLVSASYTNYLVDLTDSMKFALAVFGAIKLLQAFDERWAKGKKGYRRLRKLDGDGIAQIYSFFDEASGALHKTAVHRGLEKILGAQRVLYVDDLLGGDSFLKPSVSATRSFVLFTRSENERSLVRDLLERAGFKDYEFTEVVWPGAWNVDDKTLAQSLIPDILGTLYRLYARNR
jgi:CHASE2 domain-containing sensor protein